MEPCIRWGPGLARPCEEAIFSGKHVPGMLEDTAVSSAKMAEVIEIVCGFGIRVGRMKRRRCGLMPNYFDHL